MNMLWRLFLSCSLFSLMAVGGANALVPEMHRQVVELNHWMGDNEFVSLFAIAQAAPGPNMLIVTLIGWKVAGLAGAIVSTLAMCGPSSVIAYYVSGALQRFRHAPWRRVLERALAPVTVGLVMGAGYLLATAADVRWPTYALTAISTLVAYRTRWNPLWLLACGAAAGLLGWV